MNLAELNKKLREPFAPSQVKWLITVSKGKSYTLCSPYASLRAYQTRLDEVLTAADLTWNDSLEYQVVDRGGKAPAEVVVIVTLTIKTLDGVTMMVRTGEGTTAVTDNNWFTSAKAQAFKRACAALGVGRFLYFVPNQYLDGGDKKSLSRDDKAQLSQAYRNLYNQWMEAGGYREDGEEEHDPATVGGAPTAPPEAPAPTETPAPTAPPEPQAPPQAKPKPKAQAKPKPKTQADETGEMLEVPEGADLPFAFYQLVEVPAEVPTDSWAQFISKAVEAIPYYQEGTPAGSRMHAIGALRKFYPNVDGKQFWRGTKIDGGEEQARVLWSQMKAYAEAKAGEE
jgi:hypothetical protein